MKPIIKLLSTVVFISLLAACNSSVTSYISRFHVLPKPQGETIKIIPLDKKLSGSIEFSIYANMVGEELGKFGYKPAVKGEKADLIVELDYEIESKERAEYSPFYFGLGFYGSNFYGSLGTRYYYNSFYPYPYSQYSSFYSPWRHSSSFFYNDFYGGDFYGSHRVSMVFNRQLIMNITENNTEGKRLYEGKVRSRGNNGKLSRIMPYMIKAIFSGFPGISGEGERISIELEKRD